MRFLLLFCLVAVAACATTHQPIGNSVQDVAKEKLHVSKTKVTTKPDLVSDKPVVDEVNNKKTINCTYVMVI